MTRPTDAAPQPRPASRWAALIVLLLVAVLTTASVAATPVRSVGTWPRTALADGSVEVIADEDVPDEVLVSRTLLEAADSALVVPADASPAVLGRAVELSATRRVPVYRVSAATAPVVAAELDRLRVRRVVTVGGPIPDLRRRTSADPKELIEGPAPAGSSPVLLLSGPSAVPAATGRAAGATVIVLPVPDPRASGAAVAALKRDDSAVRAVGAGFGDRGVLTDRIQAARTVPELPGGGQLLFPSRRVVALYGSPDARTLGPLGRQDLPSTVQRAKEVAGQYGSLSSVPVIPGFEIIATIASEEPDFRGAYTRPVPVKVLEPWVDAAEKAGIYVTLDLQPGRMDFLAQAKMYERLLERPNVGLALDPEWRLAPDQVHLAQIGAVRPAEVNRTAAWLADLVRRRNLPQKAFVLHQFDEAMLGDRARLDTGHPELATVVHADGHGVPGVKLDTWHRLITGLPPGIWMGWKNFYTEDTPIFSPARTMSVKPRPWFISYQ